MICFYFGDKSNLLLTETYDIKICDFNVSKLTKDTVHTKAFEGTKPYMSPELWDCLLDDLKKYSFKTDMW